MILPKLATGLSVALLFSTSALTAQAQEDRPPRERKAEIVKKDTRLIKQGNRGNCKIIEMRRPGASAVDYQNIVSPEAVMTAAEKHARGKAFNVYLLPHHVPRYHVQVATEEGIKYLQVAADTGKVIAPRRKKDDRIFKALQGKGEDGLKMDLPQAIKQAKKNTPGRVISAKLHPEPGNMAYSVVIETKKEGRKNVMISGSTGKILAIRDHHGMMDFTFGHMRIPPVPLVPPVGPFHGRGPHLQQWVTPMDDHDFSFIFKEDDEAFEIAFQEGQDWGEIDQTIDIVKEFRHFKECD